MKTEEAVELDVDLDKPLICEVQWGFDTEITEVCQNPAEYMVLAHNENAHVNENCLMCGRCLELARNIYKCRFGCGQEPVIIHVRSL